MPGFGDFDEREASDQESHTPNLTVRSAASRSVTNNLEPTERRGDPDASLDDLLTRWNNALREVERAQSEEADATDSPHPGQQLPVWGVPMGSFARHMGIGETPAAAPDRPVESVLADVAERAIAFFAQTMPAGAGLAGEPEWVRQRQQRVAQLGAGPRRPTALLGAYLRAEQEHGRIRSDADPDAAAALLLGACFHAAFLTAYLDDQPRDSGQFARSIAGIVMDGVGRPKRPKRMAPLEGGPTGGPNMLRGPGDRRSYRRSS